MHIYIYIYRERERERYSSYNVYCHSMHTLVRQHWSTAHLK